MFETITYYGGVALAVYKALAVVTTTLSIIGIAYVLERSMAFARSRTKPRGHIAATEASMFPSAADAASSDRVFAALRDATITRWHAIVDRLAVQEQKDYKTAIIEADALVDASLLAHQFPGETMGERMRAVSREQLPCIEDLWRAHKVRNDIAHDPHYIVSPREGHDMMKLYKKALEELGAL